MICLHHISKDVGDSPLHIALCHLHVRWMQWCTSFNLSVAYMQLSKHRCCRWEKSVDLLIWEHWYTLPHSNSYQSIYHHSPATSPLLLYKGGLILSLMSYYLSPSEVSSAISLEIFMPAEWNKGVYPVIFTIVLTWVDADKKRFSKYTNLVAFLF